MVGHDFGSDQVSIARRHPHICKEATPTAIPTMSFWFQLPEGILTSVKSETGLWPTDMVIRFQLPEGILTSVKGNEGIVFRSVNAFQLPEGILTSVKQVSRLGRASLLKSFNCPKASSHL